jgi:hypothetical protein
MMVVFDHALNSIVSISGAAVKIIANQQIDRECSITKIIVYASHGCRQTQPINARFYNKVLTKGKPKKVALIAVMRKLLVLAFGVLKSGKPFDVNY